MSSNYAVSLRLADNMRFDATTSSRHEVAVDSSVGGGGHDSGARPMEILLVALGSCMGMDVISILRKMRADVASYEITVAGERASEHPRVFTSIAMSHRVHGRGVAPANVARAIQLSTTRYCPVHAMLRGSVAISEEYEVTDDATGAVTKGEVTPKTDGPPK